MGEPLKIGPPTMMELENSYKDNRYDEKIIDILLEIIKEYFSKKGKPLLENELVYFSNEK